MSNTGFLLFVYWAISMGIGVFAFSRGRGPTKWITLALILTPLIAGALIALLPNLNFEASSVATGGDSGKEYAKKTCNICGLRDIQPNMVRKAKKLKAKSKRGVTWNEVLGTVAGSKTSARALKKSLYGPPKRNHSTKRTVWMCKPCARKN